MQGSLSIVNAWKVKRMVHSLGGSAEFETVNRPLDLLPFPHTSWFVFFLFAVALQMYNVHLSIVWLFFWPPLVKSWLIGKDPDAMTDWGQEEKGTTEDEMTGWHHRLDGHESEWAPGVVDGQGGLACCSPWGCKESAPTEWLNLTNWYSIVCIYHI